MNGLFGLYPQFEEYETNEGELKPYKGGLYGWLSISEHGVIQLTEELLRAFQLTVGQKLLSIRSSDIAFVMGAKGPLIERANCYKGDIEIY